MHQLSIPSYAVNGDSASLTYAYGDSLLNSDEECWHLVEDKTKTVAEISLDSNISKGALILQTSKDAKLYTTADGKDLFTEVLTLLDYASEKNVSVFAG